jgi:signal transduction histidine kinase
MLLAVASVATLAYWDEERESRAALEDFAEDQATLAYSLAAALDARLNDVERDARVAVEAGVEGRPTPRSVSERYTDLRVRPDMASSAVSPDYHAFTLHVPVEGGRRVDFTLSMRGLLARAGAIERPNALLLLVLPPNRREFHAMDGRVFAFEPLRSALAAGQSWTRLSHEQAARLGLPPRTSIAGLAQIDAGVLGRWAIAVVASAEHERDREQRARWRLALAVPLAAGLVLAFGGVALRMQRKESTLQRELAIATVQRQRDEKLEQASKVATMGTLAMGIAHEVSTPLGVISGRAEQLLPRIAGDERAVRSVRTILEQAERINQVVRAFLGLARHGSTQARELEALAIVSGAMQLVGHRLADAGVHLVADVPESSAKVRGDMHLLQHALVNLLLNACDACERGGHVRVEVTAATNAIRFTVHDDGYGISAETAARATEPFFTTKRHGAGLGLAIVNEIVNSHGGSLTIMPGASCGTRACIELPCAKEASDEAA